MYIEAEKSLWIIKPEKPPEVRIMNNNSKKRIIVLLCVLAAAVAGLMVYIFYDPTKMDKPFKDISKDDISKVVMCYYGDPIAELNDKELDEFIDLLKEIEVGKITTETELDGFSRGDILIVFSNGDEHYIAPNGNLFDVDGVTYEALYQPCNALTNMRGRILDEKCSIKSQYGS
jgi:hypothetical protein